MAHFLLSPFGSAGDVNPFLWLGRQLAARGHEVEVITAPMFEEAASRAKLPFTGVGSMAEYEAVLSHPDLWKPLKGTRLVFQMAGKLLRPFYEVIADKIRPGETVLAAPFTMIAARVARERYKVPLATVHLQPICFLSAYDTPILMPGLEWLTRAPRWLRRTLLSMPNPADFVLGPKVKALCVDKDVIPPKRVFPHWMHSPDANLALFPEWFAAPQPDWPPNTHVTGFPLEDLKSLFPLPDDLVQWLNEGSKPVLLTPGTGNTQAAKFFKEGLEACERFGLRALLGTSFPDQLPSPLPPFARHFTYLPFSELLPQVAAFIHHGGIGTMSQAFAAGVPQLVMPMSHDQPDNVMRMRRLGTGDALPPKLFKARPVAERLSYLMQSSKVADACRQVAEKCKESNAAATAVKVMEELAERHAAKSSTTTSSLA